MFNINLRYIFSVCLLILFGICFFSAEFFMPYLRQWKSSQLLNLSKVYQDDSISNESNLLEDGIRKARIANLLDPSNSDTQENYLLLLYRSKPINALQKWAQIVYLENNVNEKRRILLERCISTLKNDLIEPYERKIAGEIAILQLNTLFQNKGWLDSPDNSLIAAELLAEIGKPEKAKVIIESSLKNHPTHAESILLFSRLTVHLKDIKSLAFIGKNLAKLAARKSLSGVEAIRHMTLLHVLNPLSTSTLEKCLELLEANTHAKPIDFMRIFALQFLSSEDSSRKNSIIKLCAEQFDLTLEDNLLIFSRWLARLGAFDHLISYVTPSKAKIDEELFKLRMNALAHINDIETIHFEVNNAPIISERWRLVIESRAFALEGNFKESIKVLDRLLPVLGNDPRLVRVICNFLEKSNDIKGLTHVLEKLTDQPVHQSFALKKLMQHRSSSATLEELLVWMSKLSKLHGNDTFFSETYLYFELLDPSLPSPSSKLDTLLNEAKQNIIKRNSSQNKITLALAHLRDRSPDKALVLLESEHNWRMWQDTRPAWVFICSEIFKMNHETEKALILRNSIDFAKLDRAEKESLAQIFPQSFQANQELINN